MSNIVSSPLFPTHSPYPSPQATRLGFSISRLLVGSTGPCEGSSGTRVAMVVSEASSGALGPVLMGSV